MRFCFIHDQRATFPVRVMCKMLDVSASGYYAWRGRPESMRTAANRQLIEEIRRVYGDSRGRYGSPRVHAALRAEGRQIGRNRVARLMHHHGICARQKRRFCRTTDSSHDFPLAPNLLGRRFTASAPDRVWLADITYIPTAEGWLYLAVVLDMFSRRVVGWAMDERITQELTLNALRMAIATRRPRPGLLHHSDRGSQYASNDYRKLLKQFYMTQSMSRKGNCWDNAPMESFFKTLKVERIYRLRYSSRDQARLDIVNWIEGFYNEKRLHSAIDYRSPADFERSLKAA